MFKHKKLASRKNNQKQRKTFKITAPFYISKANETSYNGFEPFQALTKETYQTRLFENGANRKDQYSSQKFENKENFNTGAQNSTSKFKTAKSGSLYNQGSQILGLNTSSQALVTVVLSMLGEIKQQNQFLLEKNSEMEQSLKKEIREVVRTEVRGVREAVERGGAGKWRHSFAETKPRRYYRKNFKRSRFMRCNIPSSLPAIKEAQSSLTNQDLEEEERDVVPSRIQNSSKPPSSSQSDHNNNNVYASENDTFMRKFDSSSVAQETFQEKGDEMQQSAGEKLLQMLKFHQQQQIPKPTNSRKFRCNISEIDKILEEDQSDGPGSSAKKDFSNRDSLKGSFKKRVSRAAPRKQWAVNPRKSIGSKKGGERSNSRSGRQNRMGVRIQKMGAAAKNRGGEDLILALLQEEAVGSSPEKLRQLQESNKKEDVNVDESPKVSSNNETLKIDDIVMQAKNNPVRGFRAPSQNLIEQLLNGGSSGEKDVSSRQNRFDQSAKNEEEEKRQPSRSKSKIREGKEEDEDFLDDDDDDNPFDNLIAKDAAVKGNLFFGKENKKEGKGGTAKFGDVGP